MSVNIGVSIRKFVVTLSTVAVVTAIALCGVIYFTGRDLRAQAQAPSNPPPAAAHRSSQRQISKARPAPAPANEPVRTETITYDQWTVTCRYAEKKVCFATLPMVVEQQNQRVNVGAWIITPNNQGALISLLQTPQINVGVLIAKGVELQLGKVNPLKIGYVDCSPQRCEATIPMNEALIRESIAAANGPAKITIWKADGTELSINIASIKGIDRALAALR